MTKPISVFNLKFHLASFKPSDPGIELTMRTFVVLVEFLQSHKLLNRIILKADGSFDENTDLRENDLTEEGVALAWGQFIDKWMGQHDRGTKIENVSRLQKGLDQIRAAGAREFIKSTRYYLYHTDKKPGDPI